MPVDDDAVVKGKMNRSKFSLGRRRDIHCVDKVENGDKVVDPPSTHGRAVRYVLISAIWVAWWHPIAAEAEWLGLQSTWRACRHLRQIENTSAQLT